MLKKLLLVGIVAVSCSLHTSAQKEDRLNKRPVVVLTFDDAVASHYTIVAPLLKKYNFGATFFVCEFGWKTRADSMNYMSWADMSKLHKMGFEIGNHTGHHKNVTKLSRAEMVNEIAFVELKCKENGIPKPISFAYPGNRTDSLSQVVLKEMGYRYARSGGSKLYDTFSDPSWLIPSFTMGSSDKLRARTLTALKELKPGQTLVFTIHGVPDLAHPDYSTSSFHFIEYLDFMRDHNFKVIAVRDLPSP